MPPRNHRAGRSLVAPITLSVLAVATIAASVAFARNGRVATQDNVVASVAVPAAASQPGTRQAATTVTPVAKPKTSAPAAKPKATASKPATATAKAPSAVKPAKKRVATADVRASVDAYRGLGMWVDIYDDRAWSNPGAAVRDMAAKGMRTLYLETANSRTNFSIKDRAKTGEFIRVAHRYNMKVVAWYLPDLRNEALDFARVSEAIKFRTSDGQKFDSFALDIESPRNPSVAARNRTLLSLSARMRRLAGPTYPLGAIIPSPKALANPEAYWHAFPYTDLAKTYDVFVPMSYYTWHGKGDKAAYADTVANIRVLRSQKGLANVPIHMIGGLVNESTAAEVRAFAKANKDMKTLGASLYTWDDMVWPKWQALNTAK